MPSMRTRRGSPDLIFGERITELKRLADRIVFGEGIRDGVEDRLLWLNIVILNCVLILSTALSQIVAAVLLIILVYRNIHRDQWVMKRTPLDLPIVTLFSARMLSILFSTDFAASLVAVYKELPFYLMYFVFTNVIDIENRGRIGILIRSLMLGAVVGASVGIVKYFAGIDGRASSTTSGYYTLGVVLTTALAFALATGHLKDVFRNRLIWIMECLTCAVAIVLTFNRIHWILLVLLVIVTGVVVNRRLLLYAAGLCLIAVLFSPNVRTRLESVSSGSTLTGRNVIWSAAMEKAGTHPVFGYGPRTFHSVFTHYDLLEDKKVGSWHNEALEIYMESGAVGVFAYLWVLVMSVVIAVKALANRNLGLFYRSLAGGLLLALSVHVISGLTGVFIADPLASLLFKECLALVGLLGVMTTRVGVHAPG